MRRRPERERGGDGGGGRERERGDGAAQRERERRRKRSIKRETEKEINQLAARVMYDVSWLAQWMHIGLGLKLKWEHLLAYVSLG